MGWTEVPNADGKSVREMKLKGGKVRETTEWVAETTQPPPIIEPPPVIVPPPVGGGGDRAKARPQRLFVDGINIKDHLTGARFSGHGTNLQDTRSCNACTGVAYPDALTEWKRRCDLTRSWGSNFIRLTLESVTHYGDRGIIDMVDYAGDRNLVVLLTLFSDPSFNAIGHPTDATLPVYRRIAGLVREAGHVAIGLCNEPQSNHDGAQTASLRNIFEKSIAEIRRAGFNGVISAQGHSGWARSINSWADQPLSDDNVMYETHVYSGQSTFQGQVWNHINKIPVFIGEFGPMSKSANMTFDDCRALVSQANQRQVPWLGWTLHHRCGGFGGGGTDPADSSMLMNLPGCGRGGNLQPSDWGKLIMSELAKFPGGVSTLVAADTAKG